MDCENYEPYGAGWKRDVKRLSKNYIIELLASVGRERDFYRDKWAIAQTLATGCVDLINSARKEKKESK